MSRKKLATTACLDASQVERLKQLRIATRVPDAERIREGIDLVLAREADKLTEQLELGGVKR